MVMDTSKCIGSQTILGRSDHIQQAGPQPHKRFCRNSQQTPEQVQEARDDRQTDHKTSYHEPIRYKNTVTLLHIIPSNFVPSLPVAGHSRSSSLIVY